MRKPPKVPTTREVLALPVTVDVVTAGRCFGMGRDLAYRQAASGELAPGVPVLRLGKRLVVLRAALLAGLGITERQQPATTPSPDIGPSSQVTGAAASVETEAAA